ncbi:MAG TPA: hypothetical protein VIX19_13770, partial [Terriglobales bacterium]
SHPHAAFPVMRFGGRIAILVIPMVKAGLDPNLGIDKHFLDKVDRGSQKKTVVEIESVEWQLNLL